MANGTKATYYHEYAIQKHLFQETTAPGLPWRLYYFSGALTVSIDALKEAPHRAEQLLDEVAITGTFLKGSQQVTLRTWVAATHHIVFGECTASQPCAVQLNPVAPYRKYIGEPFRFSR